MDMRGTKGKAVVQQGGVNHGSILCSLQQITKVAQMSMAASDTVASAVLIQDEHLTGTEPALWTTHQREIFLLPSDFSH